MADGKINEEMIIQLAMSIIDRDKLMMTSEDAHGSHTKSDSLAEIKFTTKDGNGASIESGYFDDNRALNEHEIRKMLGASVSDNKSNGSLHRLLEDQQLMDTGIEVMMDRNSSQLSGQGQNETMEKSGITILSSKAGDYDDVLEEMMEKPLDADNANHNTPYSSVEETRPCTSFYNSRVYFLWLTGFILLVSFSAYATFSNIQLRQKIRELEQVCADKHSHHNDEQIFSSSSSDEASNPPLLSIRTCYLEADFSLNLGDCARDKGEDIIETVVATKQGIRNFFKYASDQITNAYNKLITEAYESDVNNWWGSDEEDRKENVTPSENSDQNICDDRKNCDNIVPRANDFNDYGKGTEHNCNSTLSSIAHFVTVASLFAIGFTV